ncbi:MAG: hypothetical protein Q6363_004150 [Candidatus Njordarchaeota archaeon]
MGLRKLSGDITKHLLVIGLIISTGLNVYLGYSYLTINEKYNQLQQQYDELYNDYIFLLNESINLSDIAISSFVWQEQRAGFTVFYTSFFRQMYYTLILFGYGNITGKYATKIYYANKIVYAEFLVYCGYIILRFNETCNVSTCILYEPYAKYQTMIWRLNRSTNASLSFRYENPPTPLYRYNAPSWILFLPAIKLLSKKLTNESYVDLYHYFSFNINITTVDENITIQKTIGIATPQIRIFLE